jgi:hypothetical protein
MRLFGSIGKNTTVRILVLFCVLFLAADVFDQSSELLNTDHFNGYPNDNITTAIPSHFSFKPPPLWMFRYCSETASVAISGFQNMPCADRAPPACSAK